MHTYGIVKPLNPGQSNLFMSLFFHNFHRAPEGRCLLKEKDGISGRFLCPYNCFQEFLHNSWPIRLSMKRGAAGRVCTYVEGEGNRF